MTDHTGQVGLRQGARRWSVGWWIEKITRSHTHHTVLVLNGSYCVSAQPGGAKMVRIDSYPSLVYTDFAYQPGQAQAVADAATRMIGQQYNYAALAVIAGSFITGIPTPERVAAFVSNNHRLDCSQLCDLAILQGTGDRLFPQEPGLIWPGLYEQFT